MILNEYRDTVSYNDKSKPGSLSRLKLNHTFAADRSVLILLSPIKFEILPFQKKTFETAISIKPENLPRDRFVILDGGYYNGKKRTTIALNGEIESDSEPFSITITNITPLPVTVEKDSIFMVLTDNSNNLY